MKAFGLVLALILAGCNEEKVSFNTVEDARRQVRDNVTLIAQKYRSDTNRGDLDIYVRGDSTQSSTCPQGDGWASVDLVNRATNAAVKLKCSSVSMAIGCMTAEDFKNKRYASEEDHCNAEIPFPLPKVVH